MKLHLPKGLFTAVIAAFALSQTMWAGELVDGTYTTTSGAQGDVDMTTTATAVTTQYITPGSGVLESSIGTLKMDHKDIIVVKGTETDNFSSLTIGSIAVQNSGNLDDGSQYAQLNVKPNQSVNLQGSSGYLSFNVEAEASLTLSGTHYRINAYRGVATVAPGEVTITTLDAGLGGKALGGIVVKDGATLTINTLYNHQNNTTKAITLEKGATLLLGAADAAKVSIKGISDDSASYATVHRTGIPGNQGGAYSVDQALYVISNAQVEYNGTIGNTLTNVVLNSDTAGHTLTVNNSANTISKVTASAGTINVQNAASLGGVEMTGGTVSITNSTVDAATLKNAGGTLSISGSTIKDIVTIDADTTSGITITGAQLAGKVLNNAGADMLTVAGTWTIDDLSQLKAKGDSSISYVLDSNDLNTTNELRNGFAVSTGSYWVVEGGATQADGAKLTNATGTIEYAMTSDENGIYFSTDSSVDKSKYYITDGTVGVSTAIDAESYVVQGGTMNISGTMNASDIDYTSGSVTLADANATLVLDSADNAAQLLKLTTGNGNITIAENTTISGGASSQAKGKLTVNNGKTLQVGNGSSDASNVSSFTSVDLAGGTLFLKGKGQSVSNLSTKDAASTLKVSNWGAVQQTYELLGTTSLGAALTITSENDEKGYITIGKLTGTGNLNINGGSNNNGPVGVTINALETYSGVISVDGGNRNNNINFVAFGTIEGDISIGGLEVKNKGTVNLNSVKGTKNLGTVSVDGLSTLNLQGTIGNMTATGEGGISLADGTSITGTANIANATKIGGTVSNSGTLTISGTISDASDTAEGKLVVTGSGSLTINNAGNTYSGGTSIQGGTLTANGESALGTGKVTVEGGALAQAAALKVSELEYKSGSVSNAGHALEVGTLTVATDAKMADTGTGTVTVTDTLAVSSTNAFELGGSLVLTGATVDAGALTLGTELTEAQYVYTLGTATGGIEGGNITFTAPSIAGYKVDYLVSNAGDLNNALAGLVTADDGTTINDTLYLVLTKEAATPTLTTINVKDVDVSKSSAGMLTLTTAENAAGFVFGDALNAVMDDATWADIKAALKGEGITLDDSIAITFVGADGVAFDFGDNGETTKSITINGEVTRDANLVVTKPTLSGEGDAAGTIVGNYVTAYIPEPTSTTLSLLALAALAVRRRRR